jgi:hypothetical protein
MCKTRPILCDGQHQNVFRHQPCFLRKRWIRPRADTEKIKAGNTENTFLLPAIMTHNLFKGMGAEIVAVTIMFTLHYIISLKLVIMT